MNIKFNRKSGHCFLQARTKNGGIMISNNGQRFSIQDYFRGIAEYNIIDLNKLLEIANILKINAVICVVGSGIIAQVRMVSGVLAKTLLAALNNDSTDVEHKEKINEKYEMIKKYIKSDNRIVERKKPGLKGARAVGPTNKR